PSARAPLFSTASRMVFGFAGGGAERLRRRRQRACLSSYPSVWTMTLYPWGQKARRQGQSWHNKQYTEGIPRHPPAPRKPRRNSRTTDGQEDALALTPAAHRTAGLTVGRLERGIFQPPMDGGFGDSTSDCGRGDRVTREQGCDCLLLLATQFFAMGFHLR